MSTVVTSRIKRACSQFLYLLISDAFHKKGGGQFNIRINAGEYFIGHKKTSCPNIYVPVVLPALVPVILALYLRWNKKKSDGSLRPDIVLTHIETRQQRRKSRGRIYVPSSIRPNSPTVCTARSPSGRLRRNCHTSPCCMHANQGKVLILDMQGTNSRARGHENECDESNLLLYELIAVPREIHQG